MISMSSVTARGRWERHRVLAIELFELLVEFRVFALEVARLLEETFRGNREELARVCRAICVENGFQAFLAVLPQLFVFGAKHSRPGEISEMPLADGGCRQFGRTV